MQICTHIIHYCPHNLDSDSNIWSILLPITTAILSAGLTYYIAFFNDRKNKEKHLDDQLDNIIKTGIQYPYLEAEDFTSNWDKEKLKTGNEIEKYQRYDLYSILVFNYMERLSEYYSFDDNEIMKHVNIQEWIKMHQKIWDNQHSNSPGYKPQFKNLVTRFLK